MSNFNNQMDAFFICSIGPLIEFESIIDKFQHKNILEKIIVKKSYFHIEYFNIIMIRSLVKNWLAIHKISVEISPMAITISWFYFHRTYVE